MGVFDALKAELKDAFTRRGLRRVVYTHCDHWEPWRPIAGSDAVCERNRDEVHRFVQACSAIDFAARQTLFYKSPINFIFDHDPYTTAGTKCDPADAVRFIPRGERQARLMREALLPVVASGMEVQVHVHHENVTHNTDHRKPEVAAYLASATGRRFEEPRFALMLRMILDAMRAETGESLDRWFFVHGHWGLNASDPSVCHMTREIAILMEQGCRGDFTVPSGRPVVNPRLEVPYFITPVDAAKGYDLQEGEPELAYGNRTAVDRGKFLIWSSMIKHRGASLDYYAPWLKKRLEDLRTVALEMIAQSYAVDGALFIKTHAHSMHPNYYIDTAHAVFPHLHPPIQTLFRLLFDAAAAANCTVEFKTASELFDDFTGANYVPPGGVALTIPGPPPIVDGCVPADRSVSLATRVIHVRPQVLPQPTAVTVLRADTLLLEDDASPSIGIGAHAALKPIAHAALIGLCARTVAKNLIADAGEDAVGAVFVERAQHWSFMTSYQSRLVQYLSGAGTFRTVHEIGCGLGAMSVALAASGVATIGIDASEVRIAGSRRVLEAVSRVLAGQSKTLAAPCEFLQAPFPDAVAPYDVSTSLACMTDLVAVDPIKSVDAVVAGLARYGAVVLDLQRFDRARPQRKDTDALMWDLQKAGLGPGRIVLDLGINGRYARFDPALRR